jgi:hypothetical protein
MEGDDDVIHVAIPREHLLHLFSRYLDLSTLEPFSSDMDWACISQALQQAASEIISPPDRPLYCSASPSSAGSSPTLMPSSSRAGSLAPTDCDLPFPDDDQDIPEIDMDFDDLLLDKATTSSTDTSISIPSIGTK